MRIQKAVPGLLLATIWITSATAGPVTTNLVLWLDASNGLAADGSTWTDLSGNNHNATALPGQAPTVVPNAINGLTAALFSGGQAMSIAGQVLTDAQNYTIIALVTDPTDSNSSNTGFREIFSNWDGANETTSTFLGDTGVNPTNVRFTDAVGGATDSGATQQGRGPLTDPATPFILSGISSSTDAAIYQNSSLLFDLGAPIDPRDQSTAYYIGEQGSSPFEFWSGYLAALLVYNSALSPSDFSADTAYLTERYETTAATPEPATVAMIFMGLAMVALSVRHPARRR